MRGRKILPKIIVIKYNKTKNSEFSFPRKKKKRSLKQNKKTNITIKNINVIKIDLESKNVKLAFGKISFSILFNRF